MQGMGTDGTKQKVAVTEQLRVVLKDADKLDLDKLLETTLKLIDVGRDNGLKIGPGAMSYYQIQMMAQSGNAGMAMISFKIADPATMREQAYKLAIDDARTKATRLADLAGLKLGRILSVQDQDAAMSKNDAQMNYYIMMATGQTKPDAETGLSSSVFGEIPLTVHLNVQFEIQK